MSWRIRVPKPIEIDPLSNPTVTIHLTDLFLQYTTLPANPSLLFYFFASGYRLVRRFPFLGFVCFNFLFQ